MVRDLHKLGAKNVVLTGVSFEKGKLGVAVYTGDTDSVEYYFTDRLPISCHGTGDVYASSFAGSLCRGKTLIEAARIAHEYVCESIRKTIDDKEDHWYGVKFEKAIPFLVSQLS